MFGPDRIDGTVQWLFGAAPMGGVGRRACSHWLGHFGRVPANQDELL